MFYAQTILALTSLCFVLAMASAVVARRAARTARSELRDLTFAMDRLESEFLAVTIRLKRVEGRQTARLGRDGPARGQSGLPDPHLDPEGWRAAVRRMAIKPREEKLQ